MPRPTDTVYNLDPYWADIVKHTAAAERNLSDVQPGFPATTPCSGDVGGGSGGISDRTGNTAANAADSNFEDTAVRDLIRLKALNRDLEPLMKEYRALVAQWSYLTPGERAEGRKRRTARPTETKDNAASWCNSCLRISNSCSPVHRTTTVEKDGPPVPLCHWCYDFFIENRVLPPVVILSAHLQGRRISQDAVKKALKAAKPPVVHKPGEKHAANNEHPKRASVRRRGPGAVVPRVKR